MVEYKKLTRFEIHKKYNNMIQRCYDEEWQKENNMAYSKVTVCDKWLEDKYNTYFPFIEKEFYVIDDLQMDIDHNIIDYWCTEYSEETVLIVPHYINVLWESLEVGKTQITYNKKLNKYIVKVMDKAEWIREECDTYNEALEMFCTIKQGIIYAEAEDLKDRVPAKVYNAMINTDVRAINEKHFIKDVA